MGGVAVNAGFYGLWRTLALLGAPPAWVTGTLLVLAGLTALLGIAHAAVQPRLKRVIAYSSVENERADPRRVRRRARRRGDAPDQRLPRSGCSPQRCRSSRTLPPSRCCSPQALSSPRTRNPAPPGAGDDSLDALRGSARHRPWSGTGLAIGSLTLAGLPLTMGFVSEWFLLEALMQQFRVPVLGYRLLLALAGAAVALTAGFAGVTFVRLIGLVVLGPPAGDGGSGAAAFTRRPPLGRRLARAAPASRSCQRAASPLAAVLPLLIRVLAAGLSPVVPAPTTNGARQAPWVLGPVFSGFSVLSPSWLWIVMPLLALAVLAFTRAVAGGQDDPGTTSARLAVGNGRDRRRRLLYRQRLRQPHAPGAGRPSCTPAPSYGR